MSISTSVRRLAVAALLFLGASGCGDSATTRMAPVHGKVFYRGQPLTTGTIVFAPNPTRGTNGPLATADIQPDGTYVLHSGETFGAVVGWHRVTVVALEPQTVAAAGQGFVTPRSLVPEKYRDPELSDLACEVKAGQENGFNFNLE